MHTHILTQIHTHELAGAAILLPATDGQGCLDKGRCVPSTVGILLYTEREHARASERERARARERAIERAKGREGGRERASERASEGGR
jgi:hypothetical protein